MNIAVVGATGAVGREFLKIIEHRDLPIGTIRLLASARSAGKQMNVRGQLLTVEETTRDSFKDMDIAFISVNTELSGQLAPIAVQAGALVIDDSSFYRMDENVPLVVPEVNPQDVEWHSGIISIPNCSTTPLVVICSPLHKKNRIIRIIADTYQSVSGAGSAAVRELQDQVAVISKGGFCEPEHIPHQIAFNVIPRIDVLRDDGYTKEEHKMVSETKKILHAPDILVSSTCVRVPVYISHSMAVHLEFEGLPDPNSARELLTGLPGIQVLDSISDNLYPMPWDVSGTDDVFVGRIRKDVSHPNGLAMWIVADNLRKGAALNAIQIAEEVLRRDCLLGVTN